MAKGKGHKKGCTKAGYVARSQNIPADIVEAVEMLRDRVEPEIARPSFSKIVLAAIREGLPIVAEQCSTLEADV